MPSKTGDELSRSLYKDAMAVSVKLTKQICDLCAISIRLGKLLNKLEHRISRVEDELMLEKRKSLQR